jgi:biotin operon repressor
MKKYKELNGSWDYNFTVFDYEQKEKHALFWTDYVLVELIDYLSKRNTKKYCIGWCYASKETLAELVGISKSQINRLLKDLREKKILERDGHGHYRTLIKWKRYTRYNPGQTGTCYINHLIRRKARLTVTEMVVYTLAWNFRFEKRTDGQFADPLTRINKTNFSKMLGITRQHIHRILRHLSEHEFLVGYAGNDVYMLLADFSHENNLPRCDCKRLAIGLNIDKITVTKCSNLTEQNASNEVTKCDPIINNIQNMDMNPADAGNHILN